MKSFHLFLVLCFALIHSLLNGSIENEGVIGGPFHGIGRDSTGHIVNQVGAFADFVVTSGIIGESDRRTLSADQNSSLSAYLRLDDGTLTLLRADELEWSTGSTAISLEEGIAHATQVTKKARVSINLSAKGYTTRIFIRLDPGETAPEAIQNSGLTRALAQSTPMEGAEGWFSSPWFGNFYNSGNSWIMHQNHGWLYVPAMENTNLWYWHPRQEWVWTGPQIYPHLYRNKDGAWLYFFKEALPRKVFFNQQTNHMENLVE